MKYFFKLLPTSLIFHISFFAAASPLQKLSGVYEYVYEHNTPSLTENHYLELDTSKTPAVGTYYGTSDDFDDAREGYLPGFYRAALEKLELTESHIKFQVVMKNTKLWSEPVTPSSKGKTGKPWTVRLAKNERNYSGKISNGKITLESPDFGTRVFAKQPKN